MEKERLESEAPATPTPVGSGTSADELDDGGAQQSECPEQQGDDSQAQGQPQGGLLDAQLTRLGRTPRHLWGDDGNRAKRPAWAALPNEWTTEERYQQLVAMCDTIQACGGLRLAGADWGWAFVGSPGPSWSLLGFRLSWTLLASPGHRPPRFLQIVETTLFLVGGRETR